ncbi:MAG: protein kinase, partial [Myxococcota bacterium]
MRVGPYETLETLGQGGFGAVYRARHAASKREVALKVLSGGRDRERFAREGEMLAQLRHPNLIEVYESGLDAGRSYLALELVRGEALSEVLPRGPLTEDETVWVVRGLLQGLRHAHQRRIVHRDIKPANLLLCEDASDVRVKLVDFGIAFNDQYTRQLTATGSIIGTMRYLAPELLRGEGCSPASDLWSVGILALECLTGRRAYELSDNQLVQGILSGPPKQLSAIRSMRLHAFVARLLAPTASRSRTCDEALRLLERAAAGRVETPRRPEAPTLQGFKIDRTPSGRSGNAFETRLATTLGHAAAPAAFDRSALRESAPTALGRPGRVTPTALERPADGSARTTLERPADKGVPTAVERPARGPST